MQFEIRNRIFIKKKPDITVGISNQNKKQKKNGKFKITHKTHKVLNEHQQYDVNDKCAQCERKKNYTN